MAFVNAKREEIYWVELDPVRGCELNKTRPAVIVSRDELNARLETVVVCPLTSSLHTGWRCRMQIEVAGKPAEIAADQIRTISKTRLRQRLGVLAAAEATTLRRMMAELYGE